MLQTMLERMAQLGCSAGTRNQNCRRGICRRYGLCVPPRDEDHAYFYRCPYDSDDAWLDRAAVAGKIAQRLRKKAEIILAERGLPSPFAPKPVPDHLDLTKPLDVAALLAWRPPEAE